MLTWLPLSTPAIVTSPSMEDVIRFSAYGTGLLSLSTTVTVTNERSVPSALITCLSGVMFIPAGSPEVFITLRITSCPCLLYTSDAADEEDSVDLGGRRI